jgi:seryl-tRNA synthetase
MNQPVNPKSFTAMTTTRIDHIEAITPAMYHKTGVDGVYLRTELFEKVITGLSELITTLREDDTEVLRFPPVMSRKMLETTGYAHNFPHMLGGVCCIDHSHSAEVGPGHEFDWADHATTSDLVLTPAACYPVYPLAASRGSVPEAGLKFDVMSDCFRREPSKRLDRLQTFRMREYVCIGTGEQVLAFRERWQARGGKLAEQLELPYTFVKASDPFFGRLGQMLAAAQIEQGLKFELVVPIYSPEQPTACMSFNYHMDHFGHTWDLKDAKGEYAHTGCSAFGLDRIALALFATHGTNLPAWPAGVKAALKV